MNQSNTNSPITTNANNGSALKTVAAVFATFLLASAAFIAAFFVSVFPLQPETNDIVANPIKVLAPYFIGAMAFVVVAIIAGRRLIKTLD